MTYAGFGANIAQIVVGQTYGTRTVLGETSSRKNGTRQWECRCICGRLQKRDAHEILNPQGQNCPRCRNRSRRKTDAPILRVIGTYKNNAHKRGLVWALTNEEAKVLFASSCHYCGASPRNFGRPSTTPASDPDPDRGVYYSGLDRKDNSKGYETGNVVSCCRSCNWAKGKKSYAEFVEWLDQLVKFRSRAGVDGPHDIHSRDARSSEPTS
jgi:hypothetical protein